MIGQGPYSLLSDLIGLLMWASIGLAFAGGGWLVLAIVAYIAGAMSGGAIDARFTH